MEDGKAAVFFSPSLPPGKVNCCLFCGRVALRTGNQVLTSVRKSRRLPVNSCASPRASLLGRLSIYSTRVYDTPRLSLWRMAKLPSVAFLCKVSCFILLHCPLRSPCEGLTCEGLTAQPECLTLDQDTMSHSCLGERNPPTRTSHTPPWRASTNTL